MPRRNSGPRLFWNARKRLWYIRWTERGRGRERSTGAADAGQAQTELARFIENRAAEAARPREPGRIWVADVIGAYAAEHVPHVASVETAAAACDRLLSWWGGRVVGDISPQTCKEYARSRTFNGRQVKAGTAARELTVLRAALNHAVREKRLAAAPYVWTPQRAPARDRWLTRSEVARLIRAARRNRVSKAQGRHIPLFILMALYTGARRGALLDLRWPQVDLERGLIDFNPPGRKRTNKGRPIIPVSPKLLTVLKHCRKRSRGDHVISRRGAGVASVKTGFRNAARLAGLPGVTPHTLRHTAGTWMAQRGVDLWKIAGYLGHSHARTTELYAHHSPHYLREAAEAMGRKA